MQFNFSLTADEHNFKWRDLRKERALHTGQPGVYVFRSFQGDCLYVGKSKNLWRRLCQHQLGSHVDLHDAYFCTTYFTVDTAAADMLETHLINTLEPTLNIDKATHETFIADASERLTECDIALRDIREDLDGISVALRLSDDFEDDDDPAKLFREAELLDEHARLLRRRQSVLMTRARLRRRGARDFASSVELSPVGKVEAGKRAAQLRADIHGDARPWMWAHRTERMEAANE